MEAVDILAVVYGLDDLLFGDVLRQRQLHDESVHVVVVVKAAYFVKQTFLGDIGLKAYQR